MSTHGRDPGMVAALKGLSSYVFSAHARQRMAERRITELEVDTVLRYGRVFYKEGARVFTVGRREAFGLPLSERQRRSTEGIQVVLSDDDHVLSVYRNRNLHKLKVISQSHRRRFHKRHTRLAWSSDGDQPFSRPWSSTARTASEAK